MIGTLVLLSSLYGFGQTPPTTYISPASTVAWIQVTTNALGQPDPILIKTYELAVLPSGANLNLGIDQPIRKVSTTTDGWKGTVMANLLNALPDGPHRLQARAQNEADIWSAWSTPLDITITSTPPAAPTGLRVITVIISEQTP